MRIMKKIDRQNKYRKGSIKWALCNEDFSDLTVPQIAEVFDVPEATIYHSIGTIKKETGFRVPVVRLPPGPKKRVTEDANS